MIHLAYLTYLPMIIRLAVHEKLRMPQYQGSSLRGVLGHGLRRASCSCGDELCEKCFNNQSCPYSIAFHHIESNEKGSFSGVTTPPNPFVLYPMDKKSLYKPEDKLTFMMTLFGGGIGYVHHYIMAWDMVNRFGLGKGKARVSLDSISSLSGEIIADGGKLHPKALNPQDFSEEVQPVRRLTLHINTPMRLVQDGKPTSEITFKLILKNILRRAALLSEFYMGKPLDADITFLLSKADDIRLTEDKIYWEHRQRFSSRQQKKLTIGGFTGTLTFEGILDEFISWMKLGSIIHVGKGCTLGLGHYEIDYE